MSHEFEASADEFTVFGFVHSPEGYTTRGIYGCRDSLEIDPELTEYPASFESTGVRRRYACGATRKLDVLSSPFGDESPGAPKLRTRGTVPRWPNTARARLAKLASEALRLFLALDLSAHTRPIDWCATNIQEWATNFRRTQIL